MMHPGWMAWGGAGATIGLVLVLLLLVGAGVLVARVLLPHLGGAHSGDAAIEALRHRFASGEIDEAEYLARRTILTSTAPGGHR